DKVASQGFTWIWFLGVWTTGQVARAVSRARRDWREAFARDLPDLRDEDITGSPFAVQAYDVSPEYGGDAALARLRERIARRGLPRRRAVRRRPLRHGDARSARCLSPDLGRAGDPARRHGRRRRTVLARGHRAREGALSRVPLHGRGLLGLGVDPSAAGLRLH